MGQMRVFIPGVSFPFFPGFALNGKSGRTPRFLIQPLLIRSLPWSGSLVPYCFVDLQVNNFVSGLYPPHLAGFFALFYGIYYPHFLQSFFSWPLCRHVLSAQLIYAAQTRVFFDPTQFLSLFFFGVFGLSVVLFSVNFLVFDPPPLFYPPVGGENGTFQPVLVCCFFPPPTRGLSPLFVQFFFTFPPLGGPVVPQNSFPVSPPWIPLPFGYHSQWFLF